MTPDFPFEFLVYGTPLSHQGTGRSLGDWKDRVKDATRPLLEPGHWATEARVAVTIFHFPEDQMAADVDNIVKPILDAMNNHIYMDDKQVERVVVQKFEAGRTASFSRPSKTLLAAMDAEKPVTYIAVSLYPDEGSP